MILRTSDHGELGMSHGRMRQKFYNVYRETLSVPLIVSNPRLYPQPQSTDALASLIDVVPTLAASAGTPGAGAVRLQGARPDADPRRTRGRRCRTSCTSPTKTTCFR